MAMTGSTIIYEGDEEHIKVSGYTSGSMVKIGEERFNRPSSHVYIHFHDLAQMVTIAKEIQRQAEELMKEQNQTPEQSINQQGE